MPEQPGERVEVSEFNHIRNTTNRIERTQRQLIKRLLNNEVSENESVVWAADFINNRVEPTAGTDQLYICEIEDYSEDAWAVQQDQLDHADYFPKNWVVVFDRADDFEQLESEQKGLNTWGEQ